MNNIAIWGLDVFSAAQIIKDQRVLTSTAYKIFQERELMSTFKIDDRFYSFISIIITISEYIVKTYCTEQKRYQLIKSFQIIVDNSMLGIMKRSK